MKSEGLERFVKAQERDYTQALQEIKNGRKSSHWMWYIFPQIQGLGRSPTARYYAIKDQKEAAAYMSHPVLGSRLLEISGELLKLGSSDAGKIFGWSDDMKLRSSMTLFETVSTEPVFGKVLDKFFGGERDQNTLALLAENKKDHARMEDQQIFSRKYQVSGTWKWVQSQCFLEFSFENELIRLPFDAEFSEKTLPWLAEVAVMKMEDHIEDILFERKTAWEGGSPWDA